MLTENHRHYIRNLLSHIEHEMQDGMAQLEGEDADALFPRYADYPEPQRIAALRTHLARLRSSMRRFMDAHGIAHAGLPTIDAAWSFETRMALARNAVYELRPSYVRGHGPLDAQGEQDCRALAAELGLLLDDVGRELRRQPLRLPEGEAVDSLLGRLVAAIERHHLFELRGEVQNLLQPRKHGRVEVAMLGRVSSGKSSLINALLGQPLLPVGAVPVTAVVTRVRHADSLRIQAVDVEGGVQELSSSQLAGWIAEQGNAGNHRRLREVVVELDADILRDGVVLTDTPGLGSLHASASAHALTYLPRCDLGVVAIDASATLSMQDVDLIRALQQAHAACMVLLTKVDCISAAALQQQRDYVEAALADALGQPLAVSAVSVAASHADALRQWRDTVWRDAVVACAARSDQRAQERLLELARRVCLLLECTAPAAEPTTRPDVSREGRVLAALADAEVALRQLCGDLAMRGAEVVLRDVLPAVVADASRLVDQVAAQAGELADEVVRDIVARLQKVASDIDPARVAAMLRGAPPFVLQLPAPATVVLEARGPRAWRRHRLRLRMQKTLFEPLQQSFQAYAQALKDWLADTTGQLRRQLGSALLATDANAGGDTSAAADLQGIRACLDAALSAT
jgi:GTP-binding protein EngB required for normal cell division